MLLEQELCFGATLVNNCGLDVTGSSRWQRSKGRLPEEDKEFMKALVRQSIKMEYNKKKTKKQNRNIKAANDMVSVSSSLRFLFLSESSSPGVHLQVEQCPAAALTWRGFNRNPLCPAVGQTSVGHCGQQEVFYMSASPS